MLRKVFLSMLLVCPSVVWGQLLSVTATLTDSDGTVWVNGTCSVQVYSPSGVPFFGTTPVPTGPQACAIDGSGVLTTSIYNTSTITPLGAQYRFNISSATSAPASSFLIPVTAANMTTALSAAITRPRFDASRAFSYGYVDAEAVATQPGAQYYRTTGTVGVRVFSGSAWTSSSGGGGAPSPGILNTLYKSDGAGGFIVSAFTDNGSTASGSSLAFTAPQLQGTSIITTGGMSFKPSTGLAPGFNVVSWNGNIENGSLATACYAATSGPLILICDVPQNGSFFFRNSDGTTSTFINDLVVGPNGFTPRVFTVAALPVAATAGVGATVLVSDASTFTVGACTGGGSNFMLAVSNGTTWSCH